jgi:serine/threonine-protein phosphatase 2A regulatory subunit B'
MVYNALKLFMELNPDLFDETLQQYKQRKIECVVCRVLSNLYLIIPRSERQHAMDKYEGWKKIRATALQNANGHLPEGFAEDEPQPPPPPPPDDNDIVDLAMDLNAVSIDGDVPHELDDSGIERVPTADPGLDVSGRI